MRHVLGAIAAVLAVLALAACGAQAATAKPRPRAVLALGAINVATPCSDADTYPDVQAGAQVIVVNSAGTVIATGNLGAGHPQDAITPDVCRFPFNVKVPGGLPRYGIEIGHRGTVWYSQAEMRSGPKLTLGA